MIIDTSNVLTRRSRGITIVEILLVISVLVIMISFAVPGVGRATTRAEMKAASEQVQYSIDSARKLARMTESSVTLHADPPGRSAVQHIRLSGPGLDGANGLQEYRLPERIRLVADHPSFTFDERGLLRNPGRITLVSRVDETISSEMRLE